MIINRMFKGLVTKYYKVLFCLDIKIIVLTFKNNSTWVCIVVNSNKGGTCMEYDIHLFNKDDKHIGSFKYESEYKVPEQEIELKEELQKLFGNQSEVQTHDEKTIQTSDVANIEINAFNLDKRIEMKL